MAGFSAGGTLAIEYAARHDGIDGLATFASPASFTSIFPRESLMALIELAREVGTIKDTFFPPSPDWFYEDIASHDAVKSIGDVSPTPILVVHGSRDDLVPVSQAIELFEAAGDPRELIVLDGGEHRLRHDPRSMDTLLSWLDPLT
jgi:fermentation-respiration switch protein FrsA (DUF1100 family)